jgi:prophage regulatory protein
MAQSRNGVSLLPPEAVRLLRIRDVCAWTSLSRAALYRMVQQGDFPHPRKLGPQVVAWRSDEVAAWIDARPTASYGSATTGNLPVVHEATA